jgi:hypothetical protein
VLSKVFQPIEKHPDVSEAARSGEPTLVDPTPVSASDVIQEATRSASAAAGGDNHTVSVETVGQGTPPPDEAAPRSDSPAAAATDSAAPATTAPADSNELKPNVGGDTGELTPNVPADPNELKPNVPNDNAQPLTPPQQVNQIQPGTDNQQTTSSSKTTGTTSDTAAASADDSASDADTASSKKKKKKGIHKLVPF